MITTLKTTTESNRIIINGIEREIRKYCFNNNIEILNMFQEKRIIMSTLSFELKGELYRLNIIKKYLENFND